jgi:GTP-binding protein
MIRENYASNIAFIGRSNVGKSSAINVIAGVKGLARTGKTPGVTQLINVFQFDDARTREKNRIIDLPGYGYAKAPKEVCNDWQRLVSRYLKNRKSLKGLFVLMDVRHPLQELDCNLLSWCMEVGLPICVLLTKSDKLKSNASRKNLQDVRNELNQYDDKIALHLFSAHKRVGLAQVFSQLDSWFLT